MKVQDQNSIRRQKRAAQLQKQSKDDLLSLLGDSEDAEYPIYMTGILKDNMNYFLCHHCRLHTLDLFFQVQHFTLYAQQYLIWTNKHYRLLKGIQRKEKFLTYSQCHLNRPRCCNENLRPRTSVVHIEGTHF